MRHTGLAAVRSARVVGLLAAGSALADPTTTVITHGFSQTKGSWVQTMAQAVVARAGAGAVYRLNVATGQWDLVSSSGDRSANIALVFNWADESDFSGWGYAEGAADALYAALRDPQFRSADGPPPAANLFTGRKAQFIGHSRGASVMSDVIERLAVATIAVDQFTVLDPHPVNGTLDACILPANTDWGDVVPRKWNNVAWADDFWRADGSSGLNVCDFDGMPLTNFNNVGLSETALNSGGYSFSHSDTHLWYHGTIDLAPNPSDGEQGITNAMRTGWYPGGYTMVGYFLSHIGGGARGAQAAGDAPGVVPTVYGGTFDQGSTAGWQYHGGGGDGVIMNGAGNDGFLRLGGATANPGPFGSSRTHNMFYVPTGTAGVSFSSRIIEADAATPDDALVVTLQGVAGTVMLGSILLDHTTGWVSNSMSIPAGTARGKAYTLTFTHSRGAASESVVDVDNVALVMGPACPADLNGDGTVNAADLASVLGAWGPGGGSPDLNGDGMVNATDLGLLLGSWGVCG